MISKERHEELSRCEKILGHRFNKIEVLNKSLTHKSYAYESGKQVKDNERYEFLGDAVFDLMVSDYMLKKFPHYQEGVLSKIRAAVVSEGSLAKIARNLTLGDFLLLGKGEEQSGGRNKPSILANSLEAVAASIYLDAGFEKAVSTLLVNFVKDIDNAAVTSRYQDFKSELQEKTQLKFNTVPQYKVVSDSGPDHDKTFEICVFINNVECGSGTGKSKKEAEQKAARAAIEKHNLP